MGKKTSRLSRSDEELRQASLDIQYELVSLCSCYNLLQNMNVEWSDRDQNKAVSNAFLHALLLAARNLLAFLYSHNPRKSDIIAEDFFDAPGEWRNQREVPSPEMADGVLSRQISKRLAHLTWDRVDGTRKSWDTFQIVWNLSLALQSFVKLAEDARIHEALRTDLRLALDNLKRELPQHPDKS